MGGWELLDHVHLWKLIQICTRCHIELNIEFFEGFEHVIILADSKLFFEDNLQELADNLSLYEPKIKVKRTQ